MDETNGMLKIPARMAFTGLALCCMGTARAELPIDSLATEGLRFAYQQKYHRADSLFLRLGSNHPAGPFLQTLLAQYRMIEEQDYRDGKSLYALCETVLERSESLRKRGKKAEALFYRGMAYGAMASYEEKTSSWLSSILHGLKGISALEKCVELDSSNYDALAGLGVYHYWKGKVTSSVRWFRFLDEREKGKGELIAAVKKGRLLNHAARYSLLWAYYAEGRSDSALALADEFLRSYPANTIFLRARNDILFRKKEWKKAESGYGKLLRIYHAHPTKSRIEEFECTYKRAVALENLGRRAEAIRTYKASLEIATPAWSKTTEPVRSKARASLMELEKKR